MRILRVLIGLLLLTLCCTVAWANTASGVSNTFGIDNTIGGAPDIPSYCGSPYGPGTVLLRGQFHCHSIPDDWALYDYSGTGPDSTLSKYQSLGYDFLALTDHNQVSPESMGWQGWAPNSVEITHGNWQPWAYENDTHVLAVGTSQDTTMAMIDYPDTDDIAGDTSERVQRVHGRSGLAFVAHPDSHPYNIGVDDLVQVVRNSAPNGIGIWTPGNDSQRTWNKLVYAMGKPVWGYVEDDYHPDKLSNSKKGRTWVAVPGSPGEWWGNIKEKLRDGNYYCYYATSGKWPSGIVPPQMRVTVSNSGSQPVVSVDFDRVVDSIEFYGYDWGFFKKLKSPVSGNTDSYQATGHEKFVRVMARCEFSGGTLWMTSQPIVVNKNGNYSPYNASGMRVLSMSPELILTYVDADNKPIAPASGYVGDVFHVGTSDGLVPPGATLQLSYDGEDTSAIGGTQYLAIYRHDDATSAWLKVGGAVDPGAQTIESLITELGKYCISADLPVDTTAPQVFIDNPPYAASVAVDTTAKATVNDSLGAWRVKFYMSDHLLAEDAYGDDGWLADIKLSDYCTGDWTLKAEAEDLAGNTGSTEIPIHIVSSTPPPTVSISSPVSLSVLSGSVTAAGTCGDDVAVASVMLKVDDTLVGYADVNDADWTCGIDTTYLADGSRTLTATVEDYPGNSASSTVLVQVNNGAATSTLGAVKSATEGTSVRFAGAIVVADKSLIGDGFYAEALDRSAGIKIVSSSNLQIGDAVSVVGATAILNSEKVVNVTDVAIISIGNELPKPLGIVAKDLLTTPDSIGKIVKTWGRVTYSEATFFYIDDGSALDDNSGHIGLKVYGAVPGEGDPVGKYVTVTGISSCEMGTSGLISVIRTRSAEDIQVVQ